MRGDTLVHEAAVSGVRCVDSTGAGDLFAAGFMFAMLNDLALSACVRLGCLSGAAVIQVRWLIITSRACVGADACCFHAAQGYGAEVTPEAWAWARSKLPNLALARNLPPAQQRPHQPPPPPQHHHYAPAGAPDAGEIMTQASQTDSC